MVAILPLLAAVAPATAQNVVCSGVTSELSVVPVAGDTYVWELYKDISGVNFATDPGNCPPGDAFFAGPATGPTVSVTWVTPGTYYFKVTAYRDGCTMNLKVGEMVVDSVPTATLDTVAPICSGQATALTVRLTGHPPWSITYTANGNPATVSNITATPFQIPIAPTTTTVYQVTQATDSRCTNEIPSNSITVTVKPVPTTGPIIHN
jgi:hypothetical protein